MHWIKNIESFKIKGIAFDSLFTGILDNPKHGSLTELFLNSFQPYFQNYLSSKIIPQLKRSEHIL